MTKPIYYLPGANGQLRSGLGQALMERGFEPQGRATIGEFKRLSFDEQVSMVAEDLQQPLWFTAAARIITNSYGSYLFLHAQLRMPAHPANILMLSPIMGGIRERGHRPGLRAAVCRSNPGGCEKGNLPNATAARHSHRQRRLAEPASNCTGLW